MPVKYVGKLLFSPAAKGNGVVEASVTVDGQPTTKFTALLF
jgi:hypothetical protein